jgi:hypothetical protein
MTPMFGSPGQEARIEHVWPADPPELCDAWDAWVEHRDQLRQMLARVWERCCAQVYRRTQPTGSGAIRPAPSPDSSENVTQRTLREIVGVGSRS